MCVKNAKRIQWENDSFLKTKQLKGSRGEHERENILSRRDEGKKILKGMEKHHMRGEWTLHPVRRTEPPEGSWRTLPVFQQEDKG